MSGQVRHVVKRIRVQNDWAYLMAQTVKNPSAFWEIWVQSLDREDSPGEQNGYPLQYSCLEILIDRGAW